MNRELLNSTVLSELRLERKPVPQPTPHLHPGGDCGACVLAGLFQLEVMDVYQRFGEIRDGVPQSYHPTLLRQALNSARANGILQRIALEIPRFQVAAAFETFGPGGWLQVGGWWERLVMAIDGGYYGIVGIDFDAAGPLGSGADHIVLLNGYREVQNHVRLTTGTETIVKDREVGVGCSMKGNYWRNANEFLQKDGGFPVLYAKPR